MGRDFAIGLGAALSLHALAAVWALSLPTSLAPVEAERRLARAIVEEVKLPPPPPPPPEAPKPEPVPEPEKQEAKAPPPTQAPRPVPRNRPKPKPQDNEPPPKDEPAPLVLSQTYGAPADGGGVRVQTGDEDSFGDPAVEATPGNRRRNDSAGTAPPGAGTGGPASPPERKVEIVHAVPKTSCKAEWPDGAPASRRVVEVTMLLSIDLDGKVSSTRVLRAAGEPFDSAARKALQRCVFVPGTRDGKAFVDRVPFVVEFRPGSDA